MGARRDGEQSGDRTSGAPSHPPLLLAALLLLAFAVLLGLVEARWEPLRSVDRAAAGSLNELALANPGVVTAMRVVSDLGSPLTWWIVLPAAAVVLLVRRRRLDALLVAVAGAGGGLLNLAVKALVGRARPDLSEPVWQATGEAFPSGHTMGTTVGVGVLLVVLASRPAPGWWHVTVAAGVLLAVAVGLSRIVLGVHWVSDVLGGWLLGAAWVLAMVAVFGRRPAAG